MTKTVGYLVGVAVVVRNAAGQVLLGLRAKDQLWASFGGTLESAETVSEGGARELFEETGLRLSMFQRITFGEGVKRDGTRYVTLYLLTDCPSDQVPVNKEPLVTTELRWFDPTALPANMWERERVVIRGLPSTSSPIIQEAT